jgi:hypothetical protein
MKEEAEANAHKIYIPAAKSDPDEPKIPENRILIPRKNSTASRSPTMLDTDIDRQITIRNPTDVS